MDSSSLVALANEFSDVQLNTYAVNFEHKSELDQKFARNVAEIFGTAHSEISLTVDEATRALDELLPLLDEPFSDTAMIATYLLAKFPRNQACFGALSVLVLTRFLEDIQGTKTQHFFQSATYCIPL